eukprot:9096-Heterococcus_DN1.PRE.2
MVTHHQLKAVSSAALTLPLISHCCLNGRASTFFIQRAVTGKFSAKICVAMIVQICSRHLQHLSCEVTLYQYYYWYDDCNTTSVTTIERYKFRALRTMPSRVLQ